MTDPAGGSNDGALRLDFDRLLMLQFRGSVVTSDAGFLAYRELDDALGLSTMAGEALADARTGKNGRYGPGRPSVRQVAIRAGVDFLSPLRDERTPVAR